MKPRQIVDQFLKRHWTDSLIKKYMGEYASSWLIYASDEGIRKNAASGGTITALLAYMLETGKIDGALVLRSYVEANELHTKYEIVTSVDGLIGAQGSKYMTTNYTRDAVPLIRSFPGKLALVLLPCDTWVVNRLRKNDAEIKKKVVLRIALFCGHISDPGLTRMLIQKQKPAGVSLLDFRYRQGHWRGQTSYDFENNTSIEKPFSKFSDFQNLYFYCARKCLHCQDHTGYDSDISIGDVWLMAMKYDPIKHNAIIVRNEHSDRLVNGAIQAGYLVGKEVPIELIADAQSRSLPMHYNVSARSVAGKLLGIKISDPVHERVRPIDFLVALFILINFRITSNTRGRTVLRRLPKPLIKLYLYFLKALEVL